MSPDDISRAAEASITEAVAVERRGLDDYRVYLPFSFADGDELKIILKSGSDGRFTLTDEAHTMMYLSYHNLDAHEGQRQKVLAKILDSHSVREDDGRLIMPNIAPADIGPAVYTFAQALLKVGDMSMWRREKRVNNFMRDFRSIIPECVGKRAYTFDYKYDDVDPDGIYIVDCRIECRKPVHIYAVCNDLKAKDAVISMRYYNNTAVKPLSCVVFQDIEEVGRKTTKQVYEVTEKIIPSIETVDSALPLFLDKAS